VGGKAVATVWPERNS